MAEPTPASTDPGRDADRLNEEGKALAEAGKLDDALAKLTEAWKLKKAYDIAGNLSLVEQMTGHPDLSLEHVEYALKTFPASGKPAAREVLEKRQKDERPLVALLDLGDLPAGTTLNVNGRAIGPTPLDTNTYVMPGDVTVTAEHEGDLTTGHGHGDAGGTAVIKLDLHPKPPIVADKRPLWPAVVGFSLSGIGLGVAFGTLGVAETTSVKGCKTPSECTQTSDRQNTFSNTSLWMFVGTAVASGASVGLLVWGLGGPKAQDEKKTTWLLVPSLGGATVLGSF